jgi:hypothetical protein
MTEDRRIRFAAGAVLLVGFVWLVLRADFTPHSSGLATSGFCAVTFALFIFLVPLAEGVRGAERLGLPWAPGARLPSSRRRACSRLRVLPARGPGRPAAI